METLVTDSYSEQSSKLINAHGLKCKLPCECLLTALSNRHQREQQFPKNVTDFGANVIVSKAGRKGMPDNICNTWRMEDGQHF